MNIPNPPRHVWPVISLMMLALVACGPSATPTPEPTVALPMPPPTEVQPTLEPDPFLLSKPGRYLVGMRSFVATDPTRDRRVPITVWYPAQETAASTGSAPVRDAKPDPSGAPYPVILSSTKVADIFAPYLVSHGFTWASVDGLDSYPQMKSQMYNHPLDILFALSHVSSEPPEGLAGMIDAEHAGAIGYSFDGYNTLAISGARVDPRYYLAQCPNPDAVTQAILSELSAFSCAPANDWEAFESQAGPSITPSEDGLWQPMTDPRIRAVMPMAAEGWWLFGERGLAAVDRPVLMIDATEDALYPENLLIFEHLRAPEKSLISFVGPTHMMVYDTTMIGRMAHFAVAFFGYHLQGDESLKYYFSEDWVAQQEDLDWGPHLAE